MSTVVFAPRRLSACLAFAIALASGCGGGADELSWCGDGRAGSSRFPNETLQDWKSYADHLAIITIASVDRAELAPGAKEADRGLPVSTLQVDQLLWSAAAAPRLPSRLKMRRLSDSAVGESFLAPLVFVEDAGEWWPLDGCAPLRLDESGRVVDDSQHGPKLAGQTAEDVADKVSRTPPDARAYRYRHLRPTERVKAVMRRG